MLKLKSKFFRPMFELFQCYDQEEFFACDDKNTQLNFAASRNKLVVRSLDSQRSDNSVTVQADIEGK